MSGLSAEQVRRNEHALGLDQCKVTVNARVLFYREAEAVAALVNVGLTVCASPGTL
jgi:hypothetical protein